MLEIEWFNKPVEGSRELILKEAFKLFLQKNVEKVTVPELERVCKLRRGAIFYHFKNKEDIFEKAVELYFFSPLNFLYQHNIENIDSIEGYWIKKNDHLNYIQNWFDSEQVLVDPFIGFFHIAWQANLYIPTFKKKMMELLEADKDNWVRIISLELPCNVKSSNIQYIGEFLRNIYLAKCCTNCYNNHDKWDLFYLDKVSKIKELLLR